MTTNLCYSDWYAAFVETGKEDIVKERLMYRFDDRLRFYFPKRKLRERKEGQWRDVLRPLFPGYLLVNGRMDIDDYYRIKDVSGVWKLLLCNCELLPIPQEEIALIYHLMCDGEVIGPSDIHEEGGHVRVIDGPLSSMEGYIVKIDRRKGRAKVRVAFMGEERIVDLAVNLIAKV